MLFANRFNTFRKCHGIAGEQLRRYKQLLGSVTERQHIVPAVIAFRHYKVKMRPVPCRCCNLCCLCCALRQVLSVFPDCGAPRWDDPQSAEHSAQEPEKCGAKNNETVELSPCLDRNLLGSAAAAVLGFRPAACTNRSGTLRLSLCGPRRRQSRSLDRRRAGWC